MKLIKEFKKQENWKLIKNDAVKYNPDARMFISITISEYNNNTSKYKMNEIPHGIYELKAVRFWEGNYKGYDVTLCTDDGNVNLDPSTKRLLTSVADGFIDINNKTIQGYFKKQGKFIRFYPVTKEEMDSFQ